MELGHLQLYIVNGHTCVCGCLCLFIYILPSSRETVFYMLMWVCTLALQYASSLGLFCLWRLCVLLASFLRLSLLQSVFPRRSEPAFQGWPLAMLGPRQGQRGSNAGIVLQAQHAFSLLALQHGTSKHSLIPQGWIHLQAVWARLYPPACAQGAPYHFGLLVGKSVRSALWICPSHSC